MLALRIHLLRSVEPIIILDNLCYFLLISHELLINLSSINCYFESENFFRNPLAISVVI